MRGGYLYLYKGILYNVHIFFVSHQPMDYKGKYIVVISPPLVMHFQENCLRGITVLNNNNFYFFTTAT